MSDIVSYGPIMYERMVVTTSGAPSGPPLGYDAYKLADMCVSQDGSIWVNIVPGSPGTWRQAGTGTLYGPVNIIDDSATALTVSKDGSTYGLKVSTDITNAVTGLHINSQTAGNAIALGVLTTGTDEGMNLIMAGAGSLAVQNGAGQNLFAISGLDNAANYAYTQAATTTNPVTIGIFGTDANAGINIQAKGTGGVGFATQYVNSFVAYGGASGNAPFLASQGSDANVGLWLLGKGTGNVVLSDSSFNSIITAEGSTGNAVINNGDLVFGSTGQFITGDFTSSTLQNRVMVKTNVTDGITAFGLIPNGAGTVSNATLFGLSDPNNSSFADFSLDDSIGTVFINSDKTGTGTVRQFQLRMSGTPYLTIPVTGGVEINSGNLGVNGGVTNDHGLAVWAVTGSGTIQQAVMAQATFASTTTAEGTGVGAQIATAAASFTMTQAAAFHAFNPIKGSGSAITSSYGLLVDSQTAGTVNNYGIYINAPSGGSTANIGLLNLGVSQLVGVVGVGGAAQGNQLLTLTGTALGQTGFSASLVASNSFDSNTTDTAWGIFSKPSTAAGSFTLNNLYKIAAGVGSKGAGSTIVTCIGVEVDSMTEGNTNNYGLYINTPSGGSGNNIGAVINGGLFAEGNARVGGLNEAIMGQVTGNTLGTNMAGVYGFANGTVDTSTSVVAGLWAFGNTTINSGKTLNRYASVYAAAGIATNNGTWSNNNALYLETPSGATTNLVIDSAAGFYVDTSGRVGTSTGLIMTTIADTTLSVPATNITFSSIPSAGFKHLRLVLHLRSDQASTSDSALMQFNGDTAANYLYVYMTGNGTTTTSTASAAVSSMYVGDTTAASDSAQGAGVSTVDILDYTGTTFWKDYLALSGVDTGVSVIRHISGRWQNTAAITTIKLFPQSGTNFVAGSRVTLYGY